MNQKDRGLPATSAASKGSMASQGRPASGQKSKLFDSSFVGTAQQAVDFITNILESSTEYSVIAKDLEGNDTSLERRRATSLRVRAGRSCGQSEFFDTCTCLRT